ncbi:MAG TPA: potassium channel family protein [Solirubrobacterales bacterium]|jgi:voltage-gated potassium channel
MSDGQPTAQLHWVGRRLASRHLTVRRAAVVISLFTLSLTLISAVLIFLFDRHDFPNFGVSLWWAVQTITTVGYGDFVPHNTEGRVIGGIVMLLGVSLVAVVTASIAAAFVQAAKRKVVEDPADHPLAEKLDDIAARLDRIERALKK